MPRLHLWGTIAHHRLMVGMRDTHLHRTTADIPRTGTRNTHIIPWARTEILMVILMLVTRILEMNVFDFNAATGV